MPAKKNTPTSRSQRVKPTIDQLLIDDKKFQEKIQRKLFFDRIVHEANEALLCPGCYSADWKMHRKFWIRIVENSLIATMICRKCGRKLLFATQIEPDED
jgi:RNase P subunit RPR2